MTPTLDPVAADVYEELRPALGYEDAQHGYALANLVAAATLPIDRAALVAYDDIGVLSALLDPARCPVWALAYCGGIHGVVLPARGDYSDPTSWEAAARAKIADRPARRRGTLRALEAALRQVLPAGAFVRILRRSDPAFPNTDAPYDMTIVVRSNQTPGESILRAAAEPQRPRGVVHHFVVADGLTWEDLTGSSWQRMTDENTTWQDLQEGHR